MENMKLKLGYRKIFSERAGIPGPRIPLLPHNPGPKPLPSIARVTNAKGMEVDTPVYRSGHVTASYIHFFIGEIFPPVLYLINTHR